MLNKVAQSATFKQVRRFFDRKAPAVRLRANRRGHGFHLFSLITARSLPSGLPARLPVALAVTGLTILLIVGATALVSTPDFTVLVSAMLALCGLIAWDIIGRRYWERDVSAKIDVLASHHDRLVRETARNRSDIAILKEGLGELAAGIEAQGRALPPTGSTEAAMIETLVSRLGALGDKPRAAIGTSYDADILELEMAPPPTRPPPMSDLDDALNPDPGNYSDSVVAELLRHAVRNDRIELFMQPVVALPQRKIRMHEVYARLRAGNGTYLPAARYIDLAAQEDLVSAIDNLLLLRCLQILRDRRSADQSSPYVMNISGRTLNDRGFMGDLVAFLSQNHKMANRMIFDLSQKDLQEQAANLAPVLEGLTKLGVRFAMDRVRSRRIDIGLLKGCNIRFVKLDAGWILSEGSSNHGFSRIARLKKQLDAAGIDLIVERIENEGMLRELLDYNIDYGQGYLFGKPDHYAAYRETKTAA